MDRNLAIAQLEALLKVPGSLKVITNEVQPRLRADRKDARSPFDAEALSADPDLPKKPGSFVLHAVTRIEPASGVAGENGQYVAYTDEGDDCRGQPEALLVRLQEWRA
jgi:hypothetical protein